MSRADFWRERHDGSQFWRVRGVGFDVGFFDPELGEDPRTLDDEDPIWEQRLDEADRTDDDGEITDDF